MSASPVVALCYNLKRLRPPPGLPPDADAEWDSPATVQAVRGAIEERYPCVPVEGDLGCLARLRRLRPDLVFNMAEGWGGPAREGYVPTLCEMLALPYTASDPVTLAVCLHKSFTCNMLKAHGVPTPAGVTVSGTRVPPFALPAMVKPLHEGSSKGIRDSSLCRTQAELRREVARVRRLYRQPARVERYLRGREFTVGLLGNLPQVQVLPIVEIRFDQLPARANPIYSYEAKWLWDTAEHPLAIFDCPARVSAGLRRAIEGVCLRAYEALGIRDWCRMDVRLDDRGVPNILEVNPLPGILPDPRDNSCLPKAARAAGLTYSQLIHRVLEAAIRRCGLRSFTTKAR